MKPGNFERTIPAFLVFALLWSAHTRADETPTPAIRATPAKEQAVRLPALSVGGIRSGEIILITGRSLGSVPATVSAGQQTPKASALPLCAAIE